MLKAIPVPSGGVLIARGLQISPDLGFPVATLAAIILQRDAMLLQFLQAVREGWSAGSKLPKNGASPHPPCAKIGIRRDKKQSGQVPHRGHFMPHCNLALVR